MNRAPVSSALQRADNAEFDVGDAELRCECASPDCWETLPAEAELFRSTADCIIVAPSHLGAVVTTANMLDGRVVRAGDRFFVVALNGNGRRYPAPPSAGAGRVRPRLVWSTATPRPQKKN